MVPREIVRDKTDLDSDGSAGRITQTYPIRRATTQTHSPTEWPDKPATPTARQSDSAAPIFSAASRCIVGVTWL